MRAFLTPTLGLLVVLAAMPLRASGAKQTLLGRLTGITMSPQESTDDPVTGANDKAPSKDEDELTDPFVTDKFLNYGYRMLQGDINGIVADFWKEEDWAKGFQDPATFKTFVEAFPMLKAFSGVTDLLSKDTITTQESSGIVANIQKVMEILPEKIAEMSKAASIVDKFREYASLDDPDYTDLVSKSTQGSFKSAIALQDFIVNKEWGGLIDAKQFGIDGSEPESTKVLRSFFQQQEPELFDWVMHQGDPMVKKYVLNPTAAFEEVKLLSGVPPGATLA